MDEKDFQYEAYEEIQHNMKFVLKSKSRIAIMNQLFLSPSTKKELKDATGLSSSLINTNLNQLKEIKAIKERDGVYFLTNTIKINQYNLLVLNSAINLIEILTKHLNHQMLFNKDLRAFSSIPPLKDVEIIVAKDTDVDRVTHLIKDFFIGSNSIHSVFPYLHPEYGDIFENWLEKDVGVKLVLPEDVSDALINIISHYVPKKGIKNRYLKVKTICCDLDLAIILSDKGVLLGSYNADGTFNKNAVLVSRDFEAIEWGLELYNEYEALGGEYFALDEVVLKNEEARLKKHLSNKRTSNYDESFYIPYENLNKDNLKNFNKNDIDDISFDLCRFLIGSDIRLKLLIALLEGCKTMDELKEEIDKSPSNILRAIKELKEHELIRKNNKTYIITATGQLVALNIINYFKSCKTTEDKKSFFENHSTKSLPSTLIRKINYWDKAEIIQSDNVDYAKSYKANLKNISDSKDIKCIMPVYTKMYLDTVFNTIIEKDGTLEIITNKRILDRLLSREFYSTVQELNKKGKIRIYLTNISFETFLTTTDTFSALFLYLEDGSFDDSSVLINEDLENNQYINSLFEHMKAYCELVEL